MTTLPYGFRVVGSTWEVRRLVDAATALSAHCSCDPKAELHRECYLSAFQYGDDFRRHLEVTGSTAEFTGECWAPWLWFDVDRADLTVALTDARRLAVTIDERYRLGDGDLLAFYSGSKGFHIGLPTSLWLPKPAATFHKIARRFAERLAELAGVTIDTGVYDKVRLFRAPNSRHPKTGFHKRRLSLDELLGLSLDGIQALAAEPSPFDLPEPAATNDQAAADWLDAQDHVTTQGEVNAARRAERNGSPTLNRSTLEIICDGDALATGDRHRMLFSAAANLGEFGCPDELALALLLDAGLDSGLPPKDVRRQIECGLTHGRGTR
ncbi:MAG TPA: DNA primase [Pirellulales bacterium]|nr:DNA primase [Pirellulales bacterium]